MIEYTRGNLFDNPSQVLVNATNTLGWMGKGLALQFRQRFPVMFQDYRQACFTGSLRIGSIHAWKNPNPQPEWIVNFPTKDHWKDPSKLEYITSGLVDLVKWMKAEQITSISIPALGCGLGKLPWLLVREEIKKALAEFENNENVKITVFCP